MLNRAFVTSLVLWLLPILIMAQKAPINEVFNKIQNGNLYTVFNKLEAIKSTGQGEVKLVHIGDSHIFANILPAVIRDSLQKYFGNAGSILQLPSSVTMHSENSKKGVFYQVIAQNGIRFQDYNKNEAFWKQLSQVKADLYIISLGTNEAQFDNFNEAIFRKELALFLHNLYQTAPEASLIITSPAASFKGNYTNKIIQKTSDALLRYCIEKNIAIWDLYRICNGLSGAGAWMKAGYLTADGVHFNSTGYQVQGKLFFKAFWQAYQAYIRNR